MNREEAMVLAIPSLCTLLQGVRQCVQRTVPPVRVHGSQFHEDELIEQLLPGPGYYVDFGAAEPVECSNTWRLYERGWRGLLVDPLPWHWGPLLHQRRGDYLANCAVLSYNGHAVLRVNGTVSSVRPEWDLGDQQGELVVPCIRARELLAQYPHVRDNCRFCSIDVEGSEGDVVESIDWNLFRPEVLCLEYRAYSPTGLGKDLSYQWYPQLVGLGYVEVHRNDLNIILKRNEPWPHKT